MARAPKGKQLPVLLSRLGRAEKGFESVRQLPSRFASSCEHENGSSKGAKRRERLALPVRNASVWSFLPGLYTSAVAMQPETVRHRSRGV